MFGQLFIYNLKKTIRRKDIMFWNLLFPIGLGILFTCTFGNYSNMKEAIEPIPVAYVEEQDAADGEFAEVLTEMDESEDPLIILNEMSAKDADKALKDGDIEGIFTNGEKLTLYVKEDGINQSILETFLNQYENISITMTNIAMTHPEKLEDAIDTLNSDMNLLVEEKYTNGSMDAMMEYFYALIAMTCLYGCYMGLTCATETKADMSSLAARRVVASTNRSTIMLADLSSSLLVQYVISMFSVCVFRFVFNIQLGSKLGLIALVVLIGDLVGITTGLFIGSLGKATEGLKTAITLAVVMAESFLSGLMVSNMYYVLEDICPIVNRINPAALIVDSLYSLNIYDTYERFGRNMLGLGIWAVLLAIGSFAAIRRERYASL